MITRVVNRKGGQYICSGNNTEECARSEYYGLSTDTKPKEGINNTDIFYEMDTKKAFLFDEENQNWIEQ